MTTEEALREAQAWANTAALKAKEDHQTARSAATISIAYSQLALAYIAEAGA